VFRGLIDEGEMAVGLTKAFAPLEKEFGKQFEVKLPAAMQKGTAEAEKTIARASGTERDRSKAVEMILKAAAVDHKRTAANTEKTYLELKRFKPVKLD